MMASRCDDGNRDGAAFPPPGYALAKDAKLAHVRIERFLNRSDLRSASAPRPPGGSRLDAQPQPIAQGAHFDQVTD